MLFPRWLHEINPTSWEKFHQNYLTDLLLKNLSFKNEDKPQTIAFDVLHCDTAYSLFK